MQNACSGFSEVCSVLFRVSSKVFSDGFSSFFFFEFFIGFQVLSDSCEMFLVFSINFQPFSGGFGSFCGLPVFRGFFFSWFNCPESEEEASKKVDPHL